MNIAHILSLQISEGLKKIFDAKAEVALQETKKEFEGDYTFVTFSLAKSLRKSPVEIGQAIGEFLTNQDSSIVESFNMIQGFLNILIKESIWMTELKEMLQNDDFGTSPKNQKKVMVEYSSPNTNKPLHLGHLRNNFLGFSLANILEANGYEVVKANLVNDRGIHICKSMLAYQLHGNGETPESSGMKGDHLVGKYYVMFNKLEEEEAKIPKKTINNQKFVVIKNKLVKEYSYLQKAQDLLNKWEEGDAETIALWKKMNGWVYAGFEKTYSKIGVSFDKFYYESQTYLLGKEVIKEGLSKNIFYKKEDNSVKIDLTPDGLDEKVLLRSDGTSVYMTQDLGTADLKYKDFGMEKSVYVIGNEQDYHCKVLFLILEKLGRTYAKGLFHLSYGMVNLPEGMGRIKSREGTKVDADDLVAQMEEIAKTRTQENGSIKIEDFSESELAKLYEIIALGTLKYFLLKVEPKNTMIFNPEESVKFEGDAAPFVQYNFARTQSVMRKAKEMGIEKKDFEVSGLNPSEKAMIRLLYEYPYKVQEAGENYNPSLIVQYGYELAKIYSQFFANSPIFKAETPDLMQFRLQLSEKAGAVIQKSMKLLGIEVPEKM